MFHEIAPVLLDLFDNFATTYEKLKISNGPKIAIDP